MFICVKMPNLLQKMRIFIYLAVLYQKIRLRYGFCLVTGLAGYDACLARDMATWFFYTLSQVHTVHTVYSVHTVQKRLCMFVLHTLSRKCKIQYFAKHCKLH